MKEQLKLCAILDHDTEPIRKMRKKISEKEKVKCGNFIADKSKDGVKKILKGLKINEDERFKKFQWKK